MELHESDNGKAPAARVPEPQAAPGLTGTGVPHDELLESLDRQQAVIRDRVRGVADGDATGFYLYGRPGTSKSYTVEETLKALGRSFRVVSGYMTPTALFDLLKDFPQHVLVLDDVGLLLKSERAMQLLLAALGTRHGSREPRVVQYRRKNDPEAVHFEGGLIVISNVLRHEGSLLQAFHSRIHCHEYDPSDEEIAALIRRIAAGGYSQGEHQLAPAACLEVAEYVIAETAKYGLRLDLRSYDKAVKDRVQYEEDRTETSWRDLVRFTLRQRLSQSGFAAAGGKRAAHREAMLEVVRGILAEFPDDRPRQIRAWKERTDESSRAFYRWLDASNPGPARPAL